MFELRRVHYMPSTLEEGVLYVSDEFKTAAHVCACGCGSKVRTPLGPEKWSVKETTAGPTVRPSVGSWQKPCRSHYFITAGEVEWLPAWTEQEVQDGRTDEQARMEAYYAARRKPLPWPLRVWRWILERLGAT